MVHTDAETGAENDRPSSISSVFNRNGWQLIGRNSLLDTCVPLRNEAGNLLVDKRGQAVYQSADWDLLHDENGPSVQ